MSARTLSLWCVGAVLAASCADAPTPAVGPEPPVATSGATTPSTSTPPSSTPAAPGDVTPEGFETTTARVTGPDGTTCDLCVWVADDGERRARGLMGVTGLGAPDAMAFVYGAPRTGTFWMKNTRLPLSIAFYSPAGDFMDAFDMEPCTDDPCPKYATPRDFLVAVEVPRGGLADLGLVAGSRLELLGTPCEEA